MKKGKWLRIGVLVCGIILMLTMWLSGRHNLDSSTLVVTPVVPREGEPITVAFTLNNRGEGVANVDYSLFCNGKLFQEGTAVLAGCSARTYTYTHRNSLELGRQLSFVLQTDAGKGISTKSASIPPYPPYVMSSFVSFASFSTSVMSSIATMTYYQASFGGDVILNVGMVSVFVLMAILLFLELAPATAATGKRRSMVVSLLRNRFSVLMWILVAVFLGMVYARVALVILGLT